MNYTVEEAAAALKISPQRVRQLAPENVRRIGGMIILSAAQLRAMAKRNTKPGPNNRKKG